MDPHWKVLAHRPQLWSVSLKDRFWLGKVNIHNWDSIPHSFVEIDHKVCFCDDFIVLHRGLTVRAMDRLGKKSQHMFMEKKSILIARRDYAKSTIRRYRPSDRATLIGFMVEDMSASSIHLIRRMSSQHIFFGAKLEILGGLSKFGPSIREFYQ